MSRLRIKTPNEAQTVVEELYKDVERRITASPPGICPVDISNAFLKVCHAQTCGKCVPCRVGLGQLSELLEKRAYGETWSLIHDGGNVAFTAVEKMMDISSILTRLQTK